MKESPAVSLKLDIEEGLCSTACAAAASTAECHCVCRGHNHGALWRLLGIDPFSTEAVA